MPTKFIIATVTGISTVTGGAVGISYWYSLPTNLKHVLLNKGIKLLDTNKNTNDKDWQKLAAKYKGDEETITIKDNKKINKIGNFRIPSPTPASGSVNFELLKKECQKLFEKPIKKDKDFENAEQNAKDWCSLDSEILSDTIGDTSPSPKTSGGP